MMELGVKHLLEAAIKLECCMETTSRALVIYHHFIRCSHEANYDMSMVAASALSLSSRINEQVIDIDTILITFFCVVNKTTRVLKAEDHEYSTIKASLITLDYVIQRMLDFNLNHKLAYQYITPYLHVIFSRSAKIAYYSGEISHTCLKLISDFYLSGICLDYQADHITIACIDATLFIYGLTNEMEMIQPWYKGFCKDLTEEKVNEIQDIMFSLYEIYEKDSLPKDTNVIASTDTVAHIENATK